MKLRISGNSIRLRLRPSEVTQLEATGSVSDQVEFGAGSVFTYSLSANAQASAPCAVFAGDRLEVTVPETVARKWAGSDEVSIEGRQEELSILVEKDFRCMHKDAPDTDAYPNPELVAD
jgi:hypothetical protein